MDFGGNVVNITNWRVFYRKTIFYERMLKYFKNLFYIQIHVPEHTHTRDFSRMSVV